MDNNEFNIIGLYDHNADSYRAVANAFNNGEQVVGIVHATGTGKTYNALQLAYDNKDKKIIYVVPSNGIIEHIKKVITSNPNLDINRDFPNLEFRTYQSFIDMSIDEIEELDIDLLILDEFHHIGAPVWGARVNSIIDTHPNINVFGMTAYTVRDRGTSYERDMADSDSDELFSNKIVSRYDLCDAMIEGVLPKPIYKSAYTNLIGLESKLEEKVRTLNATSKEYQEYMSILNSVKKRIADAPSIADVVRKNVKPNGKYIYFCPPFSQEGTNDIETIKKEALEWFKKYVPEEDIIFYTSTSDMGDIGKLNRDAFYDDKTIDGRSSEGKLRIMFAINQYNEGVHAPNIDGVIMGRGTTSDIVYFEQLGRALSVRGITKEKFEEYEKYSMEQLLEICNFRDIKVSDNLPKEEIIEKLLAPVIIDLTNNYDFIKDLENNLKDRFKMIKLNGLGFKRTIKLSAASFDIEIENQDLFEMLRYVMDRLILTWDQKYELAKKYYEHHGDLEIPKNFKTINGYEYEENGVAIGQWIQDQRKYKKNNKLEQGRYDKLVLIGMRFDTKNNQKEWEEKYRLARTYYKHYGNLEIPARFKTINGYEYDESGIALGSWIRQQKTDFRDGILKEERKNKLEQLGMKFGVSIKDQQWEEKYELAKKYYEYYGNLGMTVRFKTTNGYEYDENGVAIGQWLFSQKQNKKLSNERRKKLELIGMKFDIKDNQKEWEEKYRLAKKYYEYYGNLEIPARFKTINGYEYDETGIAIGQWIQKQREVYRNNKLETYKYKKLELIGMIFEIKTNKESWEEKYGLARTYYEHYENLEIPGNFKTTNGYEYDENGVAIGQWIQDQRKHQKNNNLAPERYDKLVLIGMRFDTKNNQKEWEEKYRLARTYYKHYGNLEIPARFKTINGYEYDESGIALGSWIRQQKTDFRDGILKEERKNKLEQLGMKFGVSIKDQQWEEKYELAKKYYEYYGNLGMTVRFKTTNGYEYDENGVAIGQWLFSQKQNKKLSNERRKKLELIGMKFDSKLKLDKEGIGETLILEETKKRK